MTAINFSTPVWLINYYHVIGIISLLLNVLGLYLLMYQNNKLGYIRYFMLAYQIACFIADVHVNFLMQVVPLYPIFGGFIVGVLAEWFDMSLHFAMMTIVFIVIVQLELLNICFERKHQAIANTLNTHVLPVWFRIFAYSLCVACPISCCVWFHTVRLPKDDQWDLIKRDWPQYFSKFQTLNHFDVYAKTWWFIFLLLVTVLGGFILLSLFVIFIMDILRMMVALKLKISASRFQKHKEAIQSLLVQFAMSSFCLAPPFCLVVIIFLELEQAQLLTELCILWFATHSSANTVSLLIFFPPYRNFILKKLRLNKVVLIGGKSSNVVQTSVAFRAPERSVLSVVDVS